MEVNDGCLIFQNMESFISICDFLSSMPYNEQKIWISKLDYVSLKARYDKEDALIKDADDSLDSDCISSSWLQLLFNEHGILMIGDTIVKIQGPYSYSITDGDFSTLESIENGQDASNNKNVNVYRHSQKLYQDNEGLALRSSEVSDFLWYSDDNKRREYVKFITDLSVVNGMSWITTELHGRAQTKWIWWGFAFDDEMVSARIAINSGSSYKYATNPTDVVTIPSSTGQINYDQTMIYWRIPLGLVQNNGGITEVTLKVSYTYVKHTGISSETTAITWNE